jgi:hypothetical protein
VEANLERVQLALRVVERERHVGVLVAPQPGQGVRAGVASSHLSGRQMLTIVNITRLILGRPACLERSTVTKWLGEISADADFSQAPD